MMTIDELKDYIRNEVYVKRMQGESNKQLCNLVADLFKLYKEVAEANGVFNREEHYRALVEMLDEVEQEA